MGVLRVLLGVLVLAAAVIVFAPATLLDAPLAERTAQRLRLADARGLWWSGRGVVARANGPARIPVAWRVDVPALARGELVVRVSDPDASATLGMLAVSRGSLDVRDLRLDVPAAIAGAFDSRLDAIALGGNVTLAAPAFTVRGASRTGEIDATWKHARVVADKANVDLGTVTVDSAPVDDGMAGSIRNVGGDVAVTGTFSDRAGSLEASVTLTPTPAASQTVRTILPMLGAPDGAGGVRIAWRGRG